MLDRNNEILTTGLEGMADNVNRASSRILKLIAARIKHEEATSEKAHVQQV